MLFYFRCYQLDGRRLALKILRVQALGKEGLPMSVFETLYLGITFGIFLITFLTYIKK